MKGGLNMWANVITAIGSILGGVGDFLTPTAGGEGSLVTAAGVTAIAVMFAIPIGIKAIRKAIGLVKSI